MPLFSSQMIDVMRGATLASGERNLIIDILEQCQLATIRMAAPRFAPPVISKAQKRKNRQSLLLHAHDVAIFIDVD